MSYTWVARAARFRDNKTGRWVANTVIRTWSQQSIDASSAFDLAGRLAEGMSVGDWQSTMREGIKREYIKQYLAGRGGRARMTQVDHGSIGGSLKEQYSWLQKFSQEIADGKLSEGQIRTRSQMYFQSATEARERGKKRAEEQAGKTMVRWVRTPAESCTDCIGLSGLGWQNAEPWPFKVGRYNAICGSGATLCKVNCRCFLEWRRPQETKGSIFNFEVATTA